MAAEDFLTNVETAFLSVITANNLLKEYNWQKWDDDVEAQLPRGLIALSAIREPQETPYHRVTVNIRFEGRPKKQKLSVVINELKDLLETTNGTDLDAASGDTVKFMSNAEDITQVRAVEGGLRVWAFNFNIYVLPMV